MSHITLKQHFETSKSHHLHETDKMRIFSKIQNKIRNQSGILHRIRVHAKQGIILSSLGILLIGIYGPYLLHYQQDLIVQQGGLVITSPSNDTSINKANADTIGTIIQSQGGFSILGSGGAIATGVNFADGDTIIVDAGTSLGFKMTNGALTTLTGPAKLTIKRSDTNNGYTIYLLQGDNLSVQSAPSSNSKVDVVTEDMTIKQFSNTIKLSIVRKNGRSIITNAGGQIAVTKNGSQKPTYVASNQIVEVSNDVKIINNNIKQIASNFKNNSFEGSFDLTSNSEILQRIISSDISDTSNTGTSDDNSIDSSDTASMSAVSMMADSINQESMSKSISDASTSEVTQDTSSNEIVSSTTDEDPNTTDGNTTSTTLTATNQTTLGDGKTIIDSKELITIESLINKSFLRNEMNDLALRYFEENSDAYAIAFNNLSQKISRIASILDIAISHANNLSQLSNNINTIINESSQRYYISPRFFNNLGSVKAFINDLASKEASSITEREQEVTMETIYDVLGSSVGQYPLK